MSISKTLRAMMTGGCLVGLLIVGCDRRGSPAKVPKTVRPSSIRSGDHATDAPRELNQIKAALLEAANSLPEWQRDRRDPFVFVSDLETDELDRYRGPATTEFLEFFRATVGEPTRQVCTIALANSPKSYLRAVADLAGTAKPPSRFGFYDAQMKIAVVCVAQAGTQRLRHELTHVCMDGWRAPPWLAEGLATIAELPLTDEPPPEQKERWSERMSTVVRRRGNAAVTAQQLCATSRFSQADQAFFYAHSATWCQFLIEQGEMKRLVQALQRGDLSAERLPQLIRPPTSWQPLERRFSEWLEARGRQFAIVNQPETR